MSVSTTGEKVTYCPLQPVIDYQFWAELRKLKLDVWKLDEPETPLHGYLLANLSKRQFSTAVGAVHFRRESFTTKAELSYPNDSHDSAMVSVHIPGVLRNFNFLHSLQHLRKKESLFSILLWHVLKPLFSSPFVSDAMEECAWQDTNFAVFTLYTCIDPKTYHFYHCEAFPSFSGTSPLYVRKSSVGLNPDFSLLPSVAEEIQRHGAKLVCEHPSRGCNSFLSVIEDGSVSFFSLYPSAYRRLLKQGREVIICFTDFSATGNAICWPLRNLLFCLRLALPELESVMLYAMRAGSVDHSVLLECECELMDSAATESFLEKLSHLYQGDDCLSQHGCDDCQNSPLFNVVGWSKKQVRVVDLSSTMDPTVRADNDSRFNLQLMKWRMLPSLQLGGLAECRALLLGTGTLGCNVARNLLTWGVRRITLVDRGTVSFSNLARQSLFTFEDAKNSRAKADAAADALKLIIPNAQIEAVSMTIHMPGHRVDGSETEMALCMMQKLVDLIHTHDVVFLLTDSRESRWMPTVLCAAHGVPVLNVALGFDTYVVMRHWVASDASTSNAVGPVVESHKTHDTTMGCYFCSDVVAPSDSTTARTLDQQCTVTRPAVSSVASAIAVELLAALYQHPYGFKCDGYRDNALIVDSSGLCNLGLIPQQVRGSMYNFTMQRLYGERSPFCSACSEGVLSAYRSDGLPFLLHCVNSPAFIEEVCGIEQQKDKWEVYDGQEIDWSSCSGASD